MTSPLFRYADGQHGSVLASRFAAKFPQRVAAVVMLDGHYQPLPSFLQNLFSSSPHDSTESTGISSPPHISSESSEHSPSFSGSIGFPLLHSAYTYASLGLQRILKILITWSILTPVLVYDGVVQTFTLPGTELPATYFIRRLGKRKHWEDTWRADGTCKLSCRRGTVSQPYFRQDRNARFFSQEIRRWHRTVEHELSSFTVEGTRASMMSFLEYSSSSFSTMIDDNISKVAAMGIPLLVLHTDSADGSYANSQRLVSRYNRNTIMRCVRAGGNRREAKLVGGRGGSGGESWQKMEGQVVWSQGVE